MCSTPPVRLNGCDLHWTGNIADIPDLHRLTFLNCQGIVTVYLDIFGIPVGGNGRQKPNLYRRVCVDVYNTYALRTRADQSVLPSRGRVGVTPDSAVTSPLMPVA